LIFLPVDVSVFDLNFEDEVHKLHVGIVLHDLISIVISHPDLVAIACHQVLIAVEYSLSFETHFIAVLLEIIN
jgi:hypothetical protein